MKSIIGFVGTLIFAYLVGVFVTADFNIAAWDIGFRGLTAFVGLVSAVFVTYIAF